MTGTMLAVAGGMAAVTLVGAMLPLARRWSQQGLHLFVAVAVGIFLGTLFLHLMPELAVSHTATPHPAADHPIHPPNTPPLSPAVVDSTHAGHDPAHDDHAGHDHAAHEDPLPTVPATAPASAAPLDSASHDDHDEHGGSREPWIAALCGLLTLFLIEKIWLQGNTHLHAHGAAAVPKLAPPQDHNHPHNSGPAHEHPHDHEHDHAHPERHATQAPRPTESGLAAVPDHPPGEACDHDPHSHDIGHARERHALVWYASFLGLTIHAMLDGVNTVAVLVGATVPWPFLLSMLVHKASEGFSLATVIRLGGVPVKKTFGFLLIFSLMSPLGMIAGGLLAEQLGESHLGILRGFAAGSFLYVAVYDLLPEVFHDAQQRLLRCSAVALGILIVAVSAMYAH